MPCCGWPERFGPWQTVATRFYRWIKSGLFERILSEVRQLADAQRGIDWEVHMVDGTSVRAHRCAAGGKGGIFAKHSVAHVGASAVSCTSDVIVAGS